MVAISLYRGNLHRVPDVPRRWPKPTAQISLKDFRVLLSRRSRALSRLRSSTTIATSSNPTPNLVSEQQIGASKEVLDGSEPEIGVNAEKAPADWGEGPSGEKNDRENPSLDEASVKPVDGSDSLPAPKSNEPERGCDPVEGGAKSQEVQVQKVDELANPNSEVWETF